MVDRKRKPSSNSNNAASKSSPKKGRVKKEEPVDDNDDHKDGDFKAPIKGSLSGSRAKATKLKKEESDDEDEKPISYRSSVTKADKEKEHKRMKKKKRGEEKKAAAEKEGKRERKVYDLPGQKRDPPEERDPLRIFYETMYEQIPHSEMAQFRMMESGLLPIDEAKEVFEKKQKKIQQQKLSSPTKAPAISPVSSNKKRTYSKVAPKQTKKRKTEESSDDDDSENVLASRMKKERAN